MQLIYGGKTSQSLSKFNFPDSFSNTAESLKFLEDIIIPYLNTGEKLEVSKDQYALLILDIFSGQMTEHVKENLRENSILFVCVSANMTSLVHPWTLLSIFHSRHQSKRNLQNGTTYQSLESWTEEYRWMILRLSLDCQF